MDYHIWLLQVEAALTLVVLIILLFLLILVLLGKKIVTVPNLTLKLTKDQYDHGEEVDVTGTDQLDVDVPAQSATVNLDLVDVKGAAFPAVAQAETDENGAYSASFDVPATATPGKATLTATDPATGQTATATFTLMKSTQMRKTHGESI